MAVKLTEEFIFITVSSNNLLFPQDNESLETLLQKFCNYLNFNHQIGSFYLSKGNFRGPKLIINCKRTIIIESKETINTDFFEDLLSLDRLYQKILTEHYPILMMKYNLLKSEILIKASQIAETPAVFELAKTAVMKAVKGMGFNQEKKIEPNFPIGKAYYIVTGVNTDPSSSQKEPDWKVFPISIEIYESYITLKIKMCKNKHIIKIEDEKAIKVMAEFMNLANNDITRGFFKLNYSTCIASLESNLIIIGLDSTEIQASFQDLFSYMISVFKKYGETLSKICQISSKEEPDAPKPTIQDGSSFYLELRKIENVDEKNDYSQFMINDSSKIPEYLIIPKKYKKVQYSLEDFEKEKQLVLELKKDIDECYHIKIDTTRKIIKYPDFDGLSIKNSLKSCSQSAITAIQDFFSKLSACGYKVDDVFSNASISKESGRYILYFSETPFFSFIRQEFVTTTEELSLRLLLNERIFEAFNNLTIKEIKVYFIDASEFDWIDYEKNLGYLIDKQVELIPSSFAEIEALESVPRVNFPCIDSAIGYLKNNSNHYVVRELLSPIDLTALSAANIKNYFFKIVDCMILNKST